MRERKRENNAQKERKIASQMKRIEIKFECLNKIFDLCVIVSIRTAYMTDFSSYILCHHFLLSLLDSLFYVCVFIHYYCCCCKLWLLLRRRLLIKYKNKVFTTWESSKERVALNIYCLINDDVRLLRFSSSSSSTSSALSLFVCCVKRFFFRIPHEKKMQKINQDKTVYKFRPDFKYISTYLYMRLWTTMRASGKRNHTPHHTHRYSI